METSGWVKAGQAMAGIARLLPAAVLSAFLVVMAAAFLGSGGSVVAVVWLLAGLAVLTGLGERAAVRAFLRYRPAPRSWLAADIAGLAPGRRIEVYVAPGLSGVFCVGGHTIAAGARSVGAGTRTAALHEAAVEAVRDLGQWRTRVQLAMLWWAAAWLASMWVLGSLLGPRRMALLRVVAPVFLVMAVLVSLGRGDGAAAGLGCVILLDAILSRAARSRGRSQGCAPVPTLASVWGRSRSDPSRRSSGCVSPAWCFS